MVAAGDLGPQRQITGPLHHLPRLVQYAGTDVRMLLHDGPLVRLEPARLVQDVVRRAHLAHIVQYAGHADHVDEAGGQFIGIGSRLLQLSHDGIGELLHPQHVIAGIRITKLRQRRQRHHGCLLGAQQLVVEIEVVVCRRDPLTKHVQQIALERVERLGGGEVEHELAPVLGGDVERILGMLEAVAAIGQRTHHRIMQGREGSERHVAQQGFIVAGSGQDLQLLRAGSALGADGTFGAHVENGADLLEHPRGKLPERMQVIKIPRPLQYLAEPLPALVDGAEGLVGAQGGDDGSVELLHRQLGLGLVVVDVVVEDHPLLGGLPGLAGAQHDADQAVLHLVADLVHQPQAGVLGLHYHVEQDQGDARVGLQHAGSLGTAVGVEQG